MRYLYGTVSLLMSAFLHYYVVTCTEYIDLTDEVYSSGSLDDVKKEDSRQMKVAAQNRTAENRELNLGETRSRNIADTKRYRRAVGPRGMKARGQKVGRIIGGEDIDSVSLDQLWKPLVRISIKVSVWSPALLNFVTGENTCGGVVIHPYWLLTAAHCVFQTNYWVFDHQIELHIGKADVPVDVVQIPPGPFQHQPTTVRDKILHPESKYISPGDNVDVALIRTWDEIKDDGKTATARLPLQTGNIDWPAEGAECLFAGWGQHTWPGNGSARVGQDIEMEIVDFGMCNFLYAHNTLRPYQLCAAATGHDLYSTYESLHGPSKGDSGGPLMCPSPHWAYEPWDGSYMLAGVLTAVYDASQQIRHPAIFTRAAYVRDWIEWAFATQEAGNVPL